MDNERKQRCKKPEHHELRLLSQMYSLIQFEGTMEREATALIDRRQYIGTDTQHSDNKKAAAVTTYPDGIPRRMIKRRLGDKHFTLFTVPM